MHCLASERSQGDHSAHMRRMPFRKWLHWGSSFGAAEQSLFRYRGKRCLYTTYPSSSLEVRSRGEAGSNSIIFPLRVAFFCTALPFWFGIWSAPFESVFLHPQNLFKPVILLPLLPSTPFNWFLRIQKR